jgi:hypothetical protein
VSLWPRFSLLAAERRLHRSLVYGLGRSCPTRWPMLVERRAYTAYDTWGDASVAKRVAFVTSTVDTNLHPRIRPQPYASCPFAAFRLPPQLPWLLLIVSVDTNYLSWDHHRARHIGRIQPGAEGLSPSCGSWLVLCGIE